MIALLLALQIAAADTGEVGILHPPPNHLVLQGRYAEARAVVRELLRLSAAESAPEAYLDNLRGREAVLSSAMAGRIDTATILASFPEIRAWLSPETSPPNADVVAFEEALRRWAPGLGPGEARVRASVGAGQGATIVIRREGDDAWGIYSSDTLELSQGSRVVIIEGIYWQDSWEKTGETAVLSLLSIPVPDEFTPGPAVARFGDGMTIAFEVAEGIAPPVIQAIAPARPIVGEEVSVPLLDATGGYTRVFPDSATAAAFARDQQLRRLAREGQDTRTAQFQISSDEPKVWVDSDRSIDLEIRHGDRVQLFPNASEGSGWMGSSSAKLRIPDDFPTGQAEIRARVETGPWSQAWSFDIGVIPEVPLGGPYADTELPGYPGQGLDLPFFYGRPKGRVYFIQGGDLVPCDTIAPGAIRFPASAGPGSALVETLRVGRAWVSSFASLPLVPTRRPAPPRIRGMGSSAVQGRILQVFIMDGIVPRERYLVSLAPLGETRPFVSHYPDQNGHMIVPARPPIDAETAVLRIKAVVGEVEGDDARFEIGRPRERNQNSSGGYVVSFTGESAGLVSFRMAANAIQPGSEASIPETQPLHRRIAADLRRLASALEDPSPPADETEAVLRARAAGETWPPLPDGWRLRYIPTPGHASFTLAAEDPEGNLVLSAYAGGASQGVTYYPTLAVGDVLAEAPRNLYFAEDWRANPLGHLAADAIRSVSGCSIAVTNALGLRGNLPRGPITRGHIAQLIPFTNTVVRVTLTGAEIREILAEGSGDAHHLRISGCTVTIRTLGPEGIDVVFPNGRRLDPRARYPVATNSYLTGAEGSDFASLRRAQEKRDLGIPLRDAVAAFLVRVRPWRPDTAPRWFVSSQRGVPPAQ